jgi:DNA-binding MarR family transcriptional regulator
MAPRLQTDRRRRDGQCIDVAGVICNTAPRQTKTAATLQEEFRPSEVATLISFSLQLTTTRKDEFVMQIISTQKLCGYPVMEIRRLMRAGAGYQWGASFVAATLRIKRKAAAELIKSLVANGLIVQTESPANDRHYELTIQGMALNMASAAKPIKRLTAERLVSEFLQRVEDVNNDSGLLYFVSEVVAFGSLLTASPTLGDIDLAVMYTRKFCQTHWTAQSRQRVAIAEANGRHFSGFFEMLGWPEREIELRLRKGSRALHLHDLSEEGKFIETIPHQRIYLRQPESSPAGPGVTTTSTGGSNNSLGI